MYLVTWLTWQCLQIGPLQQKLAKLQSGSVLITKEERESVEKVAAVDCAKCPAHITHYRCPHCTSAVEHWVVAVGLAEVPGCLGAAPPHLQEHLVRP